jgi:23S rRNA (adenine2503-C2)-methyltransferase
VSNAVATQYKPLIGHSISELESFAESFDEKPFRGRQLFDWIYRQQVDDFSKMTDLSKTFRERLNKVSVHPLKLLNREESSSKQTKKYLFEVSEGKMIESVLMKEGNRTTLCLSTQVGCAVDCDFCATAKMGFVKNLTVGEIVDQFLQLQKISDQKITNVVFMGMGEPFLNYKNSIAAADLLHHPSGINMAAWRVTISTAGVAHKIKQFSDERHPYKLAVSLNGSTQNQRLKTMPITKRHSFSDLIQTSKDYAYHSRNRVTFEYVLLDGINDDPQDAEKLNRLLNSIDCKLNVIPYNEIGGLYRRPSDLQIKTFLHPLRKASFPVTVRWSKGQDIDAGCGQLATHLDQVK